MAGAQGWFEGVLIVLHPMKLHILDYSNDSRWVGKCWDLEWSMNTIWKGGGGLTHWGGVTHICVGNLTIIGPDNGVSPGRRRAIIWTNAGTL